MRKSVRDPNLQLTIDFSNTNRAQTCPQQPWNLEGSNPFLSITLSNANSCPFVPCFSACNIRTNKFIFENFPICEKSLLTMAGYAKSVIMHNAFSTNYPYIPPVFLKFTLLYDLQLDQPLECSCVLAKYFYYFVQIINLVASCAGDGQSATDWIIDNYDGCKNVTDILPDYDTIECKQSCTSVPECTSMSTNLQESTTGYGYSSSGG